jgi:IclR family KDG regulon transcriptional repressor
MPADQRERIIDGMEFISFTPNTITDKNTFGKTLDEIRRNGYAVDEQDYELGAYAFGAPVYDHEGNVVAGMSITTPTARYTPECRQERIHLVQRSAKKLSEKLGYQSTRSGRN